MKRLLVDALLLLGPIRPLTEPIVLDVERWEEWIKTFAPLSLEGES